MATYFFTFGHGHEYYGCYHKIDAQDAMVAREIMFKRFAKAWAMMYNSTEEAGIKKYQLIEVTVEKLLADLRKQKALIDERIANALSTTSE